MYRYTDKIKLKRSTSWRFVPPQDSIDAGVVTRQTFKDGRIARYEIPRLIKLIDLGMVTLQRVTLGLRVPYYKYINTM